MGKTFARTAKARPADTWGEIRARAFIFDAFQQYGYYPRTQEFIVDAAGRRVHSANIIAVKQGDSSQQLVVGAHYDSARLGQGYADNASGVGLLLEMAARLKAKATPYTLVFVAFGAEEQGMLGSRYYVRTLPGRELKATLGMIDLDAVAGGDHLFVTSQPDAAGWLRDDALTVAKQLGVRARDHAGAAAAGRRRGGRAHGQPAVRPGRRRHRLVHLRRSRTAARRRSRRASRSGTRPTTRSSTSNGRTRGA